MPLYAKVDGRFRKVKHLPLDREKTLQKIVEANLMEMLGMHFLETEYPTTFGGRIDTLAVDTNGAPVIIEYKLSKNENVINQALSYLKWLKAQKVDFFEMLIQKRLEPAMAKTIKVDWKNPRVICIAESYSKFDIDTAEVVPLRIELMRYRCYENDLLSIEPLTITVPEPPIVPPVIPPGPGLLENLLSKANPATTALFKELRGRILATDGSVVEKVTSVYAAYRVTKSFTEVWIQKNRVKLLLRPIDYEDPRGMVQRIPDSYNWTLNRSVILERPEDLDYVMGLVQQAYDDVL